MSIRTTIRLLLRGVALGSSLCSVSLLMLPLMLALLMLLFDNTAQGVMVLLGALANWFRGVLPGGDALPPYRGLALDPAALALSALLHMAPCLTGLMITLILPMRRLAWGFAALLWLVAIFADGRLVAVSLLPALLAASALFCGVVPIDGGERRPA